MSHNSTHQLLPHNPWIRSDVQSPLFSKTDWQRVKLAVIGGGEVAVYPVLSKSHMSVGEMTSVLRVQVDWTLPVLARLKGHMAKPTSQERTFYPMPSSSPYLPPHAGGQMTHFRFMSPSLTGTYPLAAARKCVCLFGFTCQVPQLVHSPLFTLLQNVPQRYPEASHFFPLSSQFLISLFFQCAVLMQYIQHL